MLDLLCKQAVYGLNEQETAELKNLGYDERERDSIDLAVAALALADLDTNVQMPAHLQSKILTDAADLVGLRTPADSPVAVAARPATINESSGSWFGWLGWAAAAAACVVLAINLYSGRNAGQFAGVVPTPSPVSDVKPDPAEQRKKMMEGSAPMMMAQIGKGNVKEIADVSGDVVWSDERQAGYLRVKGLPKNDTSKQTYQLWIFDETQDPKTPIDGGTFDINSDGEVVIPIDPMVKAKNPKMFAVTIEKAGGVVVSGREKIAALAKVETPAA